MIVSKQIKFSILVWLRVGEREFLLWKSCSGLSWGLVFYQQKLLSLLKNILSLSLYVGLGNGHLPTFSSRFVNS